MPVAGRGSFPQRAPQTEYSEPGASSSASSRGARIAQYRALKNLPRAEDALQLLRRVGAEVKGIMRKHGWFLPLLTEFSGFSKSGADLLGMNRNSGQVIYLRLRHPSSDRTLTDSFLPFEDIIGTMLHELAHNTRGPHDEVFYKVLEGLEEEWYEMRRNGGWMQGDGFESHGQTLGSLQGLGPATENVPIRQAAQRAAEMAERRRRYEEMTRGGPKRLGGLATSGAVPSTSKTPAQSAGQAASKRRQGEQSCPSTNAEREGAVKWHEEEDLILGVKVITIDDEGEGEGEMTAGQPASSRRRPPVRGPPSAPIVIESSDEEGERSDHSDSNDFVVVKELIKKVPTAAAPPARAPPRRRRQTSQSPPRTRLRGELNISGKVASEALRAQHEAYPRSTKESDHSWSCPACTLLNADHDELCSACSSPRPAALASLPSSSSKGWKCVACGTRHDGDRAALWCCVACGHMARK